jgi:hypothetical protein
MHLDWEIDGFAMANLISPSNSTENSGRVGVLQR